MPILNLTDSELDALIAHARHEWPPPPAEAYAAIPDHMRDGLRCHILQGRPTGGFLAAVLCNDLVGAFARADSENRHLIGDYCAFLQKWCGTVPCWGSARIVEHWRKAGGLQGRWSGKLPPQGRPERTQT